MLNARSATIADPNSERNEHTERASDTDFRAENITQGGSGRRSRTGSRLPSFVSSLIGSRVSRQRGSKNRPCAIASDENRDRVKSEREAASSRARERDSLFFAPAARHAAAINYTAVVRRSFRRIARDRIVNFLGIFPRDSIEPRIASPFFTLSTRACARRGRASIISRGARFSSEKPLTKTKSQSDGA